MARQRRVSPRRTVAHLDLRNSQLEAASYWYTTSFQAAHPPTPRQLPGLTGHASSLSLLGPASQASFRSVARPHD